VSTATKPAFEIRAAQPADVRYVLDSWLRAAYSHIQSAAFHLGQLDTVPALDAFAADFAKLQAAAVARSSCLIASPPGWPSKILGYLVYAPGVVVWCQTKKEHQRKGIAAALMATAGIRADDAVLFVSPSPIIRRLRRKLGWWVYQPLEQWLAQPKD
jgi:GNAT superfamily N-acetyltransferase